MLLYLCYSSSPVNKTQLSLRGSTVTFILFPLIVFWVIYPSGTLLAMFSFWAVNSNIYCYSHPMWYAHWTTGSLHNLLGLSKSLFASIRNVAQSDAHAELLKVCITCWDSANPSGSSSKCLTSTPQELPGRCLKWPCPSWTKEYGQTQQLFRFQLP